MAFKEDLYVITEQNIWILDSFIFLRNFTRLFKIFTVHYEIRGSAQRCGTVTIFYGSGSDFLKVMVPVPVSNFEKLQFRFRFQLHI